MSDRLVNRTFNYVKARAANIALDNQLQADFMTGPLTHKVLFGVDYFNQWANTDYRTAGITSIDAYSPVYNAAIPSFASLDPFILRDDRLSQAGVYVQDQIKLDRWTLTVEWPAGLGKHRFHQQGGLSAARYV